VPLIGVRIDTSPRPAHPDDGVAAQTDPAETKAFVAKLVGAADAPTTTPTTAPTPANDDRGTDHDRRENPSTSRMITADGVRASAQAGRTTELRQTAGP
jgi:hypothetical protein